MKNLLMVLIFLVGITASSAINLAQEEHAVAATEAAEHAAEEHAESPWAVVFRWINFFILFGGLGFLLKQPIAHFFEARKQEIRSGLESAQRADVEARARMSDIEKRLGRLSADVADLRHQAEQESGTGDGPVETGNRTGGAKRREGSPGAYRGSCHRSLRQSAPHRNDTG
jgi:hypothetical protein